MQKKFDKLKKINFNNIFYKCDYLNLLLCVIIFIILFKICSNVILYGDDFFYKSFSKEDLAVYISKNYEHYFMANGRVVVHLLVTAFLAIDIKYWAIVNAFMIVSCLYCIQNISSSRARVLNNNRHLTLCLNVVIFFLLDPRVTRQSVYWLTGSFNYVYPIFTLLLYWYGIENFKGKALKYLPILAIFSSQTAEQGSLMSFGLMFMYIFKAVYIDKIKVNKIWWNCLLINFIGFMTVILSPGVGVRLESADNEIDLAENFYTIAKNLFFSLEMIETQILIMKIIVIYILLKLVENRALIKNSFKKVLKVLNRNKDYDKREVKKEIKKIVGWLLAFVGVYFSYVYIIENINHYFELIVFENDKDIYISIILYTLILLGIAIYEFVKYNNSVLLMAFILAYGSQLMMIVSPVFGYRLYISFIFMILLFITEMTRSIRLPKCFYYIIVFMFIQSAVEYSNDEYEGYYSNRLVHEENLKELAKGKITQKQYENLLYTWVGPYDNDYYQPYYNTAYGAPMLAEIIWIDYEDYYPPSLYAWDNYKMFPKYTKYRSTYYKYYVIPKLEEEEFIDKLENKLKK
ncbi:MAG: DUF6056 family protein [bacterium]